MTGFTSLFDGEIDLTALDFPHDDADAVADYLGASGHLALEVHHNDPTFGEARWGKGAVCRWRNIRVREIA